MVLDSNTRGIFNHPLKTYGKSALGTDLRYIPCAEECELLIMAGIHGEEPETTFLLSRSLRLLESLPKHTAFILCANPDGMALGTRGNYNGVDLNRNFPTADNRENSQVYSRSVLESTRDTALHSHSATASVEPEVQALLNLFEALSPKSILSMHAPMGCVDAPERSCLVERLCETFMLKWAPDIGYPTPGSLGTWCKELVLQKGSGACRPAECVTLELPRMSLEALFDRYGVSFAKFLEKCP